MPHCLFRLLAWVALPALFGAVLPRRDRPRPEPAAFLRSSDTPVLVEGDWEQNGAVL